AWAGTEGAALGNATVKQSAEVHSEHAVPVVLCNLRGRAEIVDACAVDCVSDFAQLQGAFRRSGAVLGIGDVDLDSTENNPGIGAYCPHGREIRPRPIPTGHAHALCGDGCGDGTADSASNSCDDADCISVKTVHDVLSFVSERPAWDRAML